MSQHTGNSMCICMAVGIAVSIALGMNLALGIALGMLAGVAVSEISKKKRSIAIQQFQ